MNLRGIELSGATLIALRHVGTMTVLLQLRWRLNNFRRVAGETKVIATNGEVTVSLNR